MEAYNGQTMFIGWDESIHSSMSPSTITAAMDNYINGNGTYSPPVIHLPNYSVRGHYVVVLGKLSANVYEILDPWQQTVTSMTINGNSAVYSKGESTITDTIDQLHQWYNSNASITPAEWYQNETLHWQKCECGRIIEKELHRFDSWVIIKSPTTAEEGIQKCTCSVCFYSETQSIPMLKTGIWKKDSVGWWYQRADGTYPANYWEKIDNIWYYFAGSGAMVANQWVDNYYLQADGSMAPNKWIGIYYVGADVGFRKT